MLNMFTQRRLLVSRMTVLHRSPLARVKGSVPHNCDSEATLSAISPASVLTVHFPYRSAQIQGLWLLPSFLIILIWVATIGLAICIAICRPFQTAGQKALGFGLK